MDDKRRVRYIESLNIGLHDIMEEDRVLLMGEDVLDPYGGAFKVTKGLSTKFKDRVLTTPISEAGIIGMANGLALRGLRPIVEIMFGDFMTLCADQVINHAAKFRWMYNEKVRVPLVIRTPMGGRRGYGPTHSQSLEKHFLGVAGLWVVSPNILLCPGQLLKQAVLDNDDPVIFIENKVSYSDYLIDCVDGMSKEVYGDDQSFESIVMRHDNGQPDGLFLCYGGMTKICLEVIKQLKDKEGLFLDLCVLSQLSPLPEGHIAKFLERRLYENYFYVEEANVCGGWSAELMRGICEELLRVGKYHNCVHKCIGSKDTPIPSCREEEYNFFPQVETIYDEVVDVY